MDNNPKEVTMWLGDNKANVLVWPSQSPDSILETIQEQREVTYKPDSVPPALSERMDAIQTSDFEDIDNHVSDISFNHCGT